MCLVAYSSTTHFSRGHISMAIMMLSGGSSGRVGGQETWNLWGRLDRPSLPTAKLQKGNVFTSVCQEFCPPDRRLLQQMVRILLECILLFITLFFTGPRGLWPPWPPTGFATDANQSHLMLDLNSTEEFNTRPYMIMQKVCLETNIFIGQ